MTLRLRTQHQKSDELPALRSLHSAWLQELGAIARLSRLDDELQPWLQSRDTELLAVQHDAATVGFACVRQQGARKWTLEEFYVAPTERRRGLGRAAVRLVFDRHQGHWQVSAPLGDTRAQVFWRTVIADYTGGAYQCRTLIDSIDYFFESRPLIRDFSSGAR